MEVVGTVAGATLASSPRSPMDATAHGSEVPLCVATLVEARACANAVTPAPMSCVYAMPAVDWDASKPFACAVEMPVRMQGPVNKQQRRGRARLHSLASKISSNEPAGSEAAAVQGRLEAKAETRRTRVVRSLGAAGASNLGKAPSPEGLEGDDEAFEALMFDFVDENMHGRAVQERHLDRRDLELGLFGDFLEQRGHGKFVEWVFDDEKEGWKIQAVSDERGVHIPRASMVMDYVIQMAHGDKSVCPKGGRPDYRNQPWYELVSGKQQGDRMKEKAHGSGAYSDLPVSFHTIENKVSHLRLWYDELMQDSEMANPWRNARLATVMNTMVHKLGRHRKHRPKMIQLTYIRAVLETTDFDNADEVLTAAYMAKNVVRNQRAIDEFNLDWANVTWHEGTEEADGSSATRQGLSLDYVVTKNDREGHDRANEFSCSSVCKKMVELNAEGKFVFASFCPVHLLLHAKTLQARDAGVAVHTLRGPAWGKYRRIEQLLAGSTLVASDTESVAHRAKALVMVVTRAQEAAGMFYDRSIPFIVNGRAYAPPCAGVYFEVPGTGYAVHAWADARGVTHRMRQAMRTANRRLGEERIPESEIAQISSKSLRIAMATLMKRKGVPDDEIVEMGQWEDAEMMRTYLELMVPFSTDRRNTTNTLYDSEFRGEPVQVVDVGATTAPPGNASVPTVASADAGATSPPTVNEIASAVATALMERMAPIGVPATAPIAAAVPERVAVSAPEAASVQAGSAPTMAEGAMPQGAGAQTLKRTREKNRTEYQPCCEKYMKGSGALKVATVDADAALTRLVRETEGEKPAKCQKRLCAAGYHVTRKEVMNFRNSRREVDRSESLASLDAGELWDMLGM
mgnify:CR=1 FL=1